MDKKHRFTLHVNMDDFIPATDEEKSYIVQMRPSTTFFKDGVKRLCRNKVALVSLIVVAIITLSAILIPAFWPYSYDQQLGVRPGKPTVDFIKKVLGKITLFGAIYLGIVAICPLLVGKIISNTSVAIGGTSVIIVVGVALETVKQLEAQMLMRHYKGFLE